MTPPPGEPTIHANQAQMLANRVRKRFNHLKKRFQRQNIEVFRLYDNDIPEIRAVVDWYAGHLVISEYTRATSSPGWLPLMGQAVAAILEVPPDKVHLKERHAGIKNGERYHRLDHTDTKLIMAERDLKFYINPYDFVDTGLFADHRNTRQMIREMAPGKDFLNLFCYTASFSCYAAMGGASSTVSVDRSETAIQWSRENFQLNGLSEENNRLIRAHTADFLEKAKKKNQSFDLAVVDPPSFSNRKVTSNQFDINLDHPELLASVLEIMRPGGIVFFSTNHQKFTPRMRRLPATDIKEITRTTIPEDYAGRQTAIHRCWRITV